MEPLGDKLPYGGSPISVESEGLPTVAATVSPSISDKVSELENRLRHLESVRASMSNSVGVPSPPKPPSLWLTNLLQGVTLVTIAASAFWLGSLSSTVSSTSNKLDKLNESVMGVSRDSVSSRMSVIETKLDSLDKKLDSAPTK